MSWNSKVFGNTIHLVEAGPGPDPGYVCLGDLSVSQCEENLKMSHIAKSTI